MGWGREGKNLNRIPDPWFRIRNTPWMQIRITKNDANPTGFESRKLKKGLNNK